LRRHFRHLVYDLSNVFNDNSCKGSGGKWWDWSHRMACQRDSASSL